MIIMLVNSASNINDITFSRYKYECFAHSILTEKYGLMLPFSVFKFAEI